MGGREVYQNTRFFGGISLEYIELTESDFIASPGSAYTPPERGDYRRIAGSRQIQLLMDAPGVVETKQLSAVEIFLPANTILDSTNDAGNGRLFYVKNSGTGNVVIKGYLGNTLWTIRQYGIVIVVGNDNDNWDFYFTARNIDFSPESPFLSDNVQDAIVEAYELAIAIVNTSASPGFSFGKSGTLSRGAFLSNETVPSNVVGRFVYINSARIVAVFVGSEDVGTYKFGVYKHDGDGVSLTLIGTVDVVAKRGDSFTVDWSVETGKYLAVRVESTSTDQPKNVVAGLELRGTN